MTPIIRFVPLSLPFLSPNRVYQRWQQRKIQWKGVVFRIGDVIEIAKPKDALGFTTDVKSFFAMFLSALCP